MVGFPTTSVDCDRVVVVGVAETEQITPLATELDDFQLPFLVVAALKPLLLVRNTATEEIWAPPSTGRKLLMQGVVVLAAATAAAAELMAAISLKQADPSCSRLKSAKTQLRCPTKWKKEQGSAARHLVKSL
jgi:hypothetical protein